MSYASDLRAAAEAERDHPSAYNLAERVTLTTPDRLLPLLDRLEQLERVAEAARRVATAFSLDGKGDEEREAAWTNLHREIDALDREAR